MRNFLCHFYYPSPTRAVVPGCPLDRLLRALPPATGPTGPTGPDRPPVPPPAQELARIVGRGGGAFVPAFFVSSTQRPAPIAHAWHNLPTTQGKQSPF